MAEIFDFYVADNRTIKFNPIEPILQEDNGVAVWRFRIPKMLNNIDMSGFAWWFVYVNAAKQKYSEPLTLTADADDPDNYCIADYTIDYGISLTPGSFAFALEAINANGSGEIVEEWHTKTYSHSVIGTLQGNQAEYSETESDIISALMVQIQQKYNALVGGATPIPVASVSQMTNTAKVYLNTTDKNWYYYNSDSSTWVSGGQYASGIVIDPTLTQSGQAADAKMVGDEIDGKVSKPTSSPNGTAGQLLRTNGDGTTQWVEQGLPTDEQTAEAIDEWLTDHPEATTTVQDGAITEAKLSDALKLKTVKDYVTPQMFGAKGDGITDDTQAFQLAINTGKPVYISSGSIIRINGTIIINNSSVIFGSGNGSKLRVYGVIETDTDSGHMLEMFGFCLECYKTTGTAIIINKANNSNAKNALSIHDMYFYFRNNVSESLDSIILSIKGIREASIINCVFKGDSSRYGTAILFEADSTHMTMNITIAECNFYSIGTFIKMSNDLTNYIYLAGIRLINNMYISGKIGVDASYVDTLFIADSMFDFIDSPIKIDTCGVVKIHHNYIQTTTGQCIYLINTKETECRFGEITNNFIWSTAQGHVVDGIVFIGGTGKFTFWTISDNKCTALKTLISMSNCQNCEVNGNIIHDSTSFFDGNNNSTIITIKNNKADASIVNFNLNTPVSCYVSEGNLLGTKRSKARGVYTTSGNGSTYYFDIPHGLFSKAEWCNVNVSNRNFGSFGVQIPDDDHIRVLFATAPPSGTNNVIIYWEATISNR